MDAGEVPPGGAREVRFRRLVGAFAAAAALLLAPWAAIYLRWPFAQDQSAFAWVADAIVRGGLPYRDAWEVKGPLAYYLVAVSNALFGRGFWGIRLLDLLLIAAGMVPLYRVARRWADPAAGVAAVALFLLWYAALNFENTAQPDGWAGVLLVMAAAVLLRPVGEERVWRGFLAGASIGACFLFKPTYLMFLALPGAYGLVRGASRRGWLLRFALATAVGFGLPILLAVAWFAARGGLSAWFEVQGVWLSSVYTGLGLPWSARINQTLQLFTAGRFAAALPFAAAGLWLLYRRDRAHAALAAAWVALPAVNVLLQGKPWPYLWLPVHFPLAALAALGLHGVLRPALSSARLEDAGAQALRTLVLAGACVLAVGALLAPADRVLGGLALLRGGEAAAAYDAAEFGRYGRGPGSFAALAAEIRARTSPSDHVLSWGMSGTVNYLSGRPSPSRFGVSLPLTAGAGHPMRAAYRREFLAGMAATPPRFVVLDFQDCDRARAELREFPELQRILDARYRVERAFEYSANGVDGCMELRAQR